MEKYRRVTRKDVAERAGVSETIVSYVLNDNRYVDKEKRTRVLAAVKELNYTPNTYARALKGKSSKHILFIVDNTTAERFGVLMNEMDKVAQKKGMVISLSANRNNNEFVRLVMNRQFDGIIISSMSFPDKYIDAFTKAGIPVVLLVTRNYDHVTGVAKIVTGLYQGVRDCIQYFYDQGRRNIIYIDRVSRRNRFSDMSDYRYRGFVEQMEALGLEHEGHMISGYDSETACLNAIREYLSTHKVDAIMGRNDYMACMALKVVKEMGLSIPKDISIIGFDDTSVCKLVTPELTSVRMHDQIAKTAIDMIYEMRLGHGIPDSVSFPTRLVFRGSTEEKYSI